MTVLLFGFDPFLEFDENPSDLVVKRLHGRTLAGQAVVGRTLPVDYSAIEGQILSAIEAARPALLVGFGLAAGREKVSPEKVAVNYISSKMKDNSGRILEGVPIAAGQPDAFFSNLPVEGLVRELNGQMIPASLSLSAAGYICNYTMYVSLREAKRSGFRAGFIHLPCHAEWVARTGKQFPSLPLETILRAAEVSVSYFVRTVVSGQAAQPAAAR
jgi:pyroglutamyl-peptidase